MECVSKLHWKRYLPLFVIGLVLIYFLMTSANKASVERDLRSQHLSAGDFSLMHNQKEFVLSSLKGKPLILYFGYTSCPDVCPVGLALIRDVIKALDDQESVNVVFVTLDPEKDTPKQLAEYVAFFHPNFIPLTGSKKEIANVIQAYGGFFQDAVVAGKTTGLIDHSAYFYLLDHDLELVRVFDHGIKRQEFLETLRTLL